MARFKTETDSTMSAFVPKPIYCLMGLMSMIGSQEMDLTSSSAIDGAMGTVFQNLSKALELNYLEISFIFSDTLATYEKDDRYERVSILLSNRCRKNRTEARLSVKWQPESPAVYNIWSISQKHTNPRKLWKRRFNEAILLSGIWKAKNH